MRFRYSTSDASQDEFDSLPRVPLVLCREGPTAEEIGLVDSGATPFSFFSGIEMSSILTKPHYLDALL